MYEKNYKTTIFTNKEAAINIMIAYRNKKLLYILLLLVLIYVGRIQEFIPILNNAPVAKLLMAIGLFVYFTSKHIYSEDLLLLKNIRQVKYIVLIYGMMILSAPFSVWPSASISFVFSDFIKLLLFIYLLIVCINNEDELNLLCWSLVVSALLTDIACFISPRVIAGREFVGISYDPNDMALFLVITVAIMIFMFENNTGWRKILLLFTIFFSLFVIIKTGSRGSILAFGAVILSVLYQKGFKYSFKRLPVLAIIAMIVLSNSPADKIERYATMFEPDYNTTEKGGRLEIWKRGASIMLENPLLGSGVNQFATANGKLESGSWQTAHNSYVLVGAELGIIGLSLFLLLLLTSIKQLSTDQAHMKMPWLVQGIRSSFFGFCVGGFFLSWSYTAALYFLFALTIIIHKIVLSKTGSCLAAESSTSRGLQYVK